MKYYTKPKASIPRKASASLGARTAPDSAESLAAHGWFRVIAEMMFRQEYVSVRIAVAPLLLHTPKIFLALFLTRLERKSQNSGVWKVRKVRTLEFLQA